MSTCAHGLLLGFLHPTVREHAERSQLSKEGVAVIEPHAAHRVCELGAPPIVAHRRRAGVALVEEDVDEAVQRLEKSYTSPIHDGADWWNWPSPSPDPETHHGDQHGWAAEWYRLWGEMQRKQQAEIEARLQASRVEKFYVDFMSVWSKLWSDPNAEAAKQDTTPMTLAQLTEWYQDCVNAGYKVVPPDVLRDDGDCGPLCVPKDDAN